jgi:curved DNA-binding protein CbpA
MPNSEPHEVLGVSRGASQKEVREAYREMVKEHHPDVSDADDAEERFVRIREAYESMRESAEERTATGTGTERPTENGSAGGTRERPGSTSSKADHKRRKREKRKRWEDPWGGEEERTEDRSVGRERVDRMGYGWTLFEERGRFFISKNGGRGRVYIDKEGRTKRSKTLFSSRSAAEAAYEDHTRRRDNRRQTTRLGDGWRVVEKAGGYAVEGREGYLGFDGKVQDSPYWFMSLEDAKEVYYSEFGGERRGAPDAEGNEGLASRVTVGAALLPFLATVTVLNVVSSSLGLGTKGRNPYLAAGIIAVFFGTLAVVLGGYSPLLSFVLLSLAVWAGVELIVMTAGPYTADEIEG